MTTRSIPFVAATTPRISARQVLRQAWSTVSAMAQARATRRMLAEMDQRSLDDLGLSRTDAQREANRRFWDI